MFGNVLSKLFSKGAGGTVSKLASTYGDDIARNLATQYGDDVARNTLSQLGSSLSSSYSDDVAREGVKQLGKTASKSKLGDALVSASNTGLNAPMSVTRKGMREVGTDAAEKIGMLYDRTGMSTTSDLRKLGKALTGGDNSFLDEVTNAVRTNMGKGNNVDLSDLMPDIRDFAKKLDDPVKRRMGLAADGTVLDPVALENTLKGVASDTMKSATLKTGDKANAKAMNEVAREIANRIDSNVDPKYVQRMFDDTSNELLTRSRETLLSGDKKMSTAYKKLAKEFAEVPAESRSIAQFRSMKKDFVDMEKLGKLSDQSQGGGSISRAVNQLPVVGPMVDALASKPMEAAAQKAGEATRKLGRAFQSGNAQQALKTAGAIGGGGLVLSSLLGGGGDQSQTSQGMSPMGGLDTGAVGMSGVGGGSNISSLSQALAAQTPQEEPTVGGYTRQQLEDGYVQALMAGDAKSADAIGSIIDVMNNNEKRTSTTDKTDDATKKKQAGLSTLNTLLQSYERGGGGQGILGGTLTNLLNTATGGAYNSSAATYAKQSRGAAAQIIKALGESGNLSDRDIQSAIDMLPTTTDSKSVAQEKIANLKALLSQ